MHAMTMTNRMRSAVAAAIMSAILGALLIVTTALLVHESLSVALWGVPLCAVIGFLAQYYVWGRDA